MLSYGSWTDLKTRRVPNWVWIYGGSFGSLLLIYEVSSIWEDYGAYLWALVFATIILFFNSFQFSIIVEFNSRSKPLESKFFLNLFLNFIFSKIFVRFG